ncbi:MAG: V-type ATP synthase subunit E [Rectinema sp.]
MDLQLQELLDRIKTEGVDAAKTEAATIIEDAGRKAAAMIAEAERKVAGTEADSAARIASMESASLSALTQASRDALIALRAKVQSFLDQAVRSDAVEAFSAATVASLLPVMLAKAAETGSDDLEVLLDPETLKKLDASLAKRLALELGKGVELKPFDGIDAGFRISAVNGSVQYDYSAESAAAIIASRVNSRLAECVRNAVGLGADANVRTAANVRNIANVRNTANGV